MEILANKHPSLMDPVLCTDCRGVFEPYARIPRSLPLQCDQALVEKVTGKLGGSVHPSGMNAYAFSNLLFQHGQVSKSLREEIMLWV